MAMTADDIASHPELERCARAQAQTLLSMQESSPRIASVFATQQRWLMSHAALARYFRNEASQAGNGLLTEHFLGLVVQHRIASRGCQEASDEPQRTLTDAATRNGPASAKATLV
jgi:hypothetical protein